jgi:anthranilate phosphoribosyltransferase
MIKEAIEKIKNKKDLGRDEMKAVFNEIMEGKAGHEDMKSFLVSLAEKGETVDEITEAVSVMRDKMTKIDLPFDTILDTCGTGGGASSFNVSTVVSLVAAGAGIKVAKHGNRSYTSHCGSADVLGHLGVKIDIPPERAGECISEVGMVFLFAPLYHKAMKHVIGARKEIKRRTIFNILGPLSNPAGANVQIIGTFEEYLTGPIAEVLMNVGAERAFVVHGLDGFDEASISGESRVSELKGGRVRTYNIKPEDFGIKRAKKDDVSCRDLNDNVAAVRGVLDGEKGPKRDMVLINASLALAAAGISDSFKDGVSAASESIESGRAKKVLKALIDFTNR